MDTINPLRKFYYWIGELLGFIEKNGCYSFEGVNTNGLAVHQRLGYKYVCTPHFVKDC